MKKILYLIALFMVMASCQDDDITVPDAGQTPSPAQENAKAIPGHIRVKLKAGTPVPQIVKTKSGGISTGLQNVDLGSLHIGAYHMKRVFAGKYEKRLQQEGLDRWYDIYFDEGIATRSAVSAYATLPEVEVVEQVYEARLLGATPLPEYILPVQQLSRMAAMASQKAGTKAGDEEVYPFNDPDLPKQWHYRNNGKQLEGSVPGADVNAFNAWKVEKGSPNVIVAVMDGGIQYNHPDLEANMWINTKEKNGTPEVDDDGNGYIDDIYGFNFVTGKKNADGVYANGAITQYEHGTHCAGTISAVNNNKRGVCGIAGGSGKGDGVRLMSCQIFHTEGDKSSGSTDPNMYVYAADNGAVISQNSWTGGVSQIESEFLNSAIKEAIDYFIKYAGCSEDGQQLPGSPMKGGMVIYATANNNTDIKVFPAAYDKNLRVAAMGPAFQKAVYSNYGDWADITAPGGEQNLGEEFGILSTSINNGYSWLQGTSMACPHVSGCAALILSKFQGPGYTSADLRDRIMNTAGNIDQYNPKYAGKLGRGYIDVGTALTPATTEPPATTELKLVDSYDDWAIVEWNVMTAADGPINKYDLYWSTQPITFVAGENVVYSKTAGENVVYSKTFDVRFKNPGDRMRDTVTGLESGMTYYYLLRSSDRWGNLSEYSPGQSRSVTPNLAPKLTPLWSGFVAMDEGSKRILPVRFHEPEGQQVTVTLSPSYAWLTTELKDTVLNVTVAPDFGNAGKYSSRLTVCDQYGKSSSVTVAFEVAGKVVAPKVVAPIQDLVFTAIGQEQAINLNKVFENPSHGQLLFEVSNTDNSVAWAQRKNADLVLSAKKNGTTVVTVRAVNENNLTASLSFKISVQSNSNESAALTTYPDAVSKELTVIVANSLQGPAQLRVYNSAGKQMIAQQAHIGASGYLLDMGKLARGIYVLTVEVQGQRLTKNIIKI